MRKLFLPVMMLYAANAFCGEYVVAGLGDARASIKAGAVGASASSSNPVSGIAVGHQFRDNLAVEVEYMGFGSTDFPGGTASGYSAGIFALASTPLCVNCYGNDWALFGRIGVADTVLQLKAATDYTLQVSSSSSRIAPAYGLGVQVTDGDTKSRILRLSFCRYAGGDSVTSVTFSTFMITAGVAFK